MSRYPQCGRPECEDPYCQPGHTWSGLIDVVRDPDTGDVIRNGNQKEMKDESEQEPT